MTATRMFATAMPVVGEAATTARMKRQKRTDTVAEMLLRKALDELDLVYETASKPVPDLRRSADIVFPDAGVAVFVDGCFWHGCPDHSRATKSITKWWADKIAANKYRDTDTNARLEAAGWAVVRVWEHEEPASGAQRVAAVVREAQPHTECPLGDSCQERPTTPRPSPRCRAAASA